MIKFIETLNNVRNNDIKAINKSIKDIGVKHHTAYMTDMMFKNDISINYQLLCEIQNAVNSFYCSVNENYIIKKEAEDIIKQQHKSSLVIQQNFSHMSNDQLLELVYQQAIEYYFRIDLEEDTNWGSCFEEVIKYRVASDFLRSDIVSVLSKMYEDTKIVIEDTKNIEFLLKNYKKISEFNDKYQFILEQLIESIHNVLLRDEKFQAEYFVVVRKISSILQQYFCGG